MHYIFIYSPIYPFQRSSTHPAIEMVVVPTTSCAVITHPSGHNITCTWLNLQALKEQTTVKIRLKFLVEMHPCKVSFRYHIEGRRCAIKNLYNQLLFILDLNLHSCVYPRPFFML